MQTSLSKALAPATIMDALEEFLKDAHHLYRRADYFLMDPFLENHLCRFVAATPQTISVFTPTTTDQNKKSEEEGVIRPRLRIKGVPVLPSHLINQPNFSGLDDEEHAEEEELYRDYWIIYLL